MQAADFQRLLATPACSRSAHFAVHHVPMRPSSPRRAVVHPSSTDLSTETGPAGDRSVDNLPDRHWLGSVIPKRHARRSVTRNLLRRQIREAVMQQRERLPRGLWLVRLRTPFAREQFPSAASDALRQAARAELTQLFGRAGAVAARA
ncbi:MAG: ribonuclease P protein component [Rubrivivax sp.]